MSGIQDELDHVVDDAVSKLEQAINDNRLQAEPLGLVLKADIATLRAQQRLYVAASQDMADKLEQARLHLERTRQPVQDAALRQAVMSGVRDYAIGIAQGINFGAVIGVAALALVFGFFGFISGTWWEQSRMVAEVDRMKTEVAIQDNKTERIMVEAKELGGVVLSAKSAAIWTDLVRMNHDVASAMRACQPLKQLAGSACLLPIWTLPPPPQLETPATH
jgi:hypothetical protein